MNQELEKHIMIALFKATIEQSTILKDAFKQKPKFRFKTWELSGNNLLNELESKNMINQDYIDSLSDVFHNIINEIRKNNEVK